MQATVINKTLRALARPSRSGQSIIIIALGFIALIAFVGIATDTAMLFVRYSTLRRAVDAAAIAAAGAIRQSNVATGTGFATVAASAEQYIKIHGLDPTSVRVDTCATEVYDYIVQHPGPYSYSSTADQATVSRLLANTVGEQLCTLQPQKLVRVAAQIQSPTAFLSLIGFNTVTLSASSVSQTAVLDVALLIDASMSQAYDTAFRATNGSNGPITAFTDFTQLWPATYGGSPYNPAYDSTNLSGQATTPGHPLGTIRAECRGSNVSTRGNYAYGGCCNEPVTMSPPTSASVATTWYIALNGAINTANVVSGENPETTAIAASRGKNYSPLMCKPFKYVRDSARTFLTNINFAQGDRAFLVVFDQAIHQLTSGGDYNSPDDMTTATLPVFTTSDGAIQALNKYAGVEVNVTGTQLTSSGGSCLANFTKPYDWNARYFKNNPYFYYGTPLVALYETVAPCNDTNTGGAILGAQGVITNPSWIRRTAVWVMVLLSDGYPNRTPGLTAVSGLGGSPAIGGANTYGDLHTIGDPQYNPANSTYPQFFITGAYPPHTVTSGGNTLIVSGLTQHALSDPGFCPWYTFCDSSAGGYPGAPSGQPNTDPAINNLNGPIQPLAYTMYPDGYSSPVVTDANGVKSIDATVPRSPDPTVPNALHYNSLYCPQTEIESNPIWWQADVVGTGQVPAGTMYYDTTNGSKVFANYGSPIINCTATDPDIRHFCFDVGTGAINPTDTTKCSNHYDPKDYARDMVDYAALTDYTTTVKGNSIAMYSIFFSHSAAGPGNPNNDIKDNILGVKFMRYVADAGDNATIDNHVQAWFRKYSQPPYNQTDPHPPDDRLYSPTWPFDGSNTTIYPATTEDPCAKYDFDELHLVPGINNPTPSLPTYPNGTGYENVYKTSCGNYYYADSPDSINRAFVDIAGKLFTRLAH